MLTFRKGTGGTPTAAQAMAEHLRQQTLPEELVSMADYYLRGVSRAAVEDTAAIPRQDMPLAVAEALGLDMDGSKFGMGKRSKRYSMLVKDGVVEQLNVEAPGAFEVSSAEKLLTEM